MTVQDGWRAPPDAKQPRLGRLLTRGSLGPEHRRQLEKTVIEARDIAEAGARAALEALAVHHHEPYEHMDSDRRRLRRRLRAHARHLGDRVDRRSGSHSIDHLVHECAYEHWHGMLFARFLAENQLLIEPDLGVPVTLEECEELAVREGLDKWALAARYAHRMLPQVFRPDHPALEVPFAREHRRRLEALVERLPDEVFAASDALGWVYQFWQTKRKDQVNRSEVKIGADELPAVTQLFTEPYMVQFLLHNSLGAWWVTRHPDEPCPVDLTYLRWTDDREPAAGSFMGWPDDLSEFRLLDPCCGSGHFLVAAFLMLVPMRVALEDLTVVAAVDAVLRENLHGLELDRRCVAIAAFALALEAWLYPGAAGFRVLPKLNLAWCGQPVAGTRDDWLALAAGDARLRAGLGTLHDAFREAPTLGSLVDPAQSVSSDLLTAGFDELRPLLERALLEHAGEEDREETAIAALGLSEASRLLINRYDLVITNVPYLTRGKQAEPLRRFCEARYPLAKGDLANVFLERCLEFCEDAGRGVTQLVMPQNWLFLTSYQKQRDKLLRLARWELLARLGEGAFDSTQAAGAFTILFTLTRRPPGIDHSFRGVDASEPRTAGEKAEMLRSGQVVTVNQTGQLDNPDARIGLEEIAQDNLMSELAYSYEGLTTGDLARFVRRFWEIDRREEWALYMQNSTDIVHFAGRSDVVCWGAKGERISDFAGSAVKGTDAWGKLGLRIGQMRRLPVTLYTGEVFGKNAATVIPDLPEDIAALWCFCASPEYSQLVRRIDQSLAVTVGTLNKIPFDRQRWRRVARERYPNGLPEPYSNDPTQWLFHGHPCGSVVWDEEKRWTAFGALRRDGNVLQVAVGRLLGFRWPPERDRELALAAEQRTWVAEATDLSRHLDPDGIVCLPSVRGEQPAHERLLTLLHDAYGDGWNEGLVARLLESSGSASLDDWLRNKFFEGHCELFHHRPFVWHVWDGRKADGFHALVNYHKLVEGNGKGRRILESLTYSYLGDHWIKRQQDGVKRGESGAEGRLAAAVELQSCLVAILEGEAPFDIFVRWKPLNEQPIGWEPDIDDGVRLNIRPFMTHDLPGGRKGAGILRVKPRISWGKDRGRDPRSDEALFPWLWNEGEFTGARFNHIHLTNAEKRAARRAAGREE